MASAGAPPFLVRVSGLYNLPADKMVMQSPSISDLIGLYDRAILEALYSTRVLRMDAVRLGPRWLRGQQPAQRMYQKAA